MFAWDHANARFVCCASDFLSQLSTCIARAHIFKYKSVAIISLREKTDDKKRKKRLEQRSVSKSRGGKRRRRTDDKGRRWISIDGAVRHGQTIGPRRMIGSFPIVAHNQQYTFSLDILDSRSVGAVSSVCSSVSSVCREASARAYTHTRENTRLCVQLHEWRCTAAENLTPLRCNGALLSVVPADVPFIAREATTLLELFRLTGALKTTGSTWREREGGKGTFSARVILFANTRFGLTALFVSSKCKR